MALFKNKFVGYNFVNLGLLMLSNILFACAFCVLFVGDLFTADYYFWLKVVDVVCLFVLAVALFLCSVLLCVKNKSKQKQRLRLLLNILEILIIVVAFLNLISFYDGAVFGVLVAGVVAFCLSQFVLAFMFCSQDEDFVEVDAQNYVLQQKDNTQIFTQKQSEPKNICFLFGSSLNILVFLLLIVWFASDLLPKLLLEQNVEILVLCLAVCLALVCLVLCGFCAGLFKSSPQKTKSESWIVLSLLTLNFVIFLGLGVLCFAKNSVCSSVVLICLILALTQVCNTLLLKDWLKIKQNLLD